MLMDERRWDEVRPRSIPTPTLGDARTNGQASSNGRYLHDLQRPYARFSQILKVTS
jgi:hypothetical protein